MTIIRNLKFTLDNDLKFEELKEFFENVSEFEQIHLGNEMKCLMSKALFTYRVRNRYENIEAILIAKEVNNLIYKNTKLEALYMDKTLDLSFLAVKKYYRGKGVGSHLLKRMEASAKKAGFRKIRVLPIDEKSEEFYKSHGFYYNKNTGYFIKEI